MAKKQKRKDGLSFSTGSDAPADNPFAALAGLSDLPAAPASTQKDLDKEEGAAAGADPDWNKAMRTMELRVMVDRKQRRGKAVTLITGFDGPAERLDALAKALKAACGVGGSVKDGEIIIQGEKRKRVLELLRERGYKNVKRVGG